MKRGALSDYFTGVGTKTLQGTEIDPKVSRGHELQGIDAFRAFIGSPSEKQKVPVTYVWLSDTEGPASLDLEGTWYDSRHAKAHRVPEYRLYYPAAAEEIVYRSRAGDRLFLCQARDGRLLALFCARSSSIEQQLLWLFGLEGLDSPLLQQVDLRERNDRTLDPATRYILELIDIEVDATEESWLDRIIEKFGETFPSTRKFSEFARNAAKDVDCVADPDVALLAWMDLEERLFMTLEKHIVGRRLELGFVVDGKPDVDAFVNFSLGVQNRRKSRAGWAFGNHIETILLAHDIRFVREATTEKRNGPDFLFPGEVEYHNSDWPPDKLFMLAAKTSCKDRWRQVLSEADRIKRKHLLTLEPGISPAQTNEMKKEDLQLVLPRSLHQSFLGEQRGALMSLATFLDFVRDRR